MKIVPGAFFVTHGELATVQKFCCARCGGLFVYTIPPRRSAWRDDGVPRCDTCQDFHEALGGHVPRVPHVDCHDSRWTVWLFVEADGRWHIMRTFASQADALADQQRCYRTWITEVCAPGHTPFTP